MQSAKDRRSRFLPTVATIASVALAGCSTQDGRIGADDGSDGCRPYRVALDSTGDYFGTSIATGAVLGAMGGALIGYMAGGNARSAAIGAAAGATLGAAGGYFAALQQQKQDQALVQQMYTDVEQANAQIDKTQLAFDQLVACRNALAGQVRNELAAGRIARPEAERRMAVLRQQYAQDIAIGKRIEGAITERSANFEFANEQINPRLYAATGNTPLYAGASGSSGAMGTLVTGNLYWGSRANDEWVKIFVADGRVGYAPLAGVRPYQDPAASQPPQQQQQAQGWVSPDSGAQPQPQPAGQLQLWPSPQLQPQPAPSPLWPQPEQPTVTPASPPPAMPEQETAAPPPPAPAPAMVRPPPPTQTASAPPPPPATRTSAPAGGTSAGAVNQAVSTNLAKKSAFGANVRAAEARAGGFELNSSG